MPKALKSCPKSKKSPNLVTLVSTQFLKMCQSRPLFVYFRSFQKQILQKKTEGFREIRIQIIGPEGKHDDHLTTTQYYSINAISKNKSVYQQETQSNSGYWKSERVPSLCQGCITLEWNSRMFEVTSKFWSDKQSLRKFLYAW